MTYNDKVLMEVYRLPLNECYKKMWDFKPDYIIDSEEDE